MAKLDKYEVKQTVSDGSKIVRTAFLTSLLSTNLVGGYNKAELILLEKLKVEQKQES